jgi:hypothetical protein
MAAEISTLPTSEDESQPIFDTFLFGRVIGCIFLSAPFYHRLGGYHHPEDRR